MKLRLLEVKHFVGDTVKGATSEDDDDDTTFTEFISQRKENELIELYYEIDSEDKHHIVLFYSKQSS